MMDQMDHHDPRMLVTDSIVVALKQIDLESWHQIFVSSVILFSVWVYVGLAKGLQSDPKQFEDDEDDDFGNISYLR